MQRSGQSWSGAHTLLCRRACCRVLNIELWAHKGNFDTNSHAKNLRPGFVAQGSQTPVTWRSPHAPPGTSSHTFLSSLARMRPTRASVRPLTGPFSNRGHTIDDIPAVKARAYISENVTISHDICTHVCTTRLTSRRDRPRRKKRIQPIQTKRQSRRQGFLGALLGRWGVSSPMLIIPTKCGQRGARSWRENTRTGKPARGGISSAT